MLVLTTNVSTTTLVVTTNVLFTIFTLPLVAITFYMATFSTMETLHIALLLLTTTTLLLSSSKYHGRRPSITRVTILRYLPKTTTVTIVTVETTTERLVTTLLLHITTTRVTRISLLKHEQRLIHTFSTQNCITKSYRALQHNLLPSHLLQTNNVHMQFSIATKSIATKFNLQRPKQGSIGLHRTSLFQV